MRHMSKKIKIELVTPLERICITLSNGVKIMDIYLTQPKLLDAEHAYMPRVESFKRRKTNSKFAVK